MASSVLAGEEPVVLTATLQGPETYTPGGDNSFVYRLQNPSAGTVSGIRVAFDVAPATVVGFECTVVGTGSSCSDVLTESASTGNAIAAGGQIEFQVSVAYAADLRDDPLEFSVFATGENLVAPPRTVSSALRRQSDLAVTLSQTGDPTAAYTPGQTGVFTAVLANQGPSDADGVGFSVPAPDGVEFSWTCAPAARCPQTSGSGSLVVADQALAAGQTVSYKIDASFAAGLQADPLELVATLTVPAELNDPNSDDHVASVSLDRVPVADLSVAFLDGAPVSYVPGRSDDSVLLLVANLGPSDLDDGLILLVPSSEDGVVPQVILACEDPSAGVECTVGEADPDTGSAALAELAIPASGSVVVRASQVFPSAARSDLNLRAEVFSASGDEQSDPNPGNNVDQIELLVDRRADLAVTKTANVSSVSPDGSFVYEIRVENLGPSDIGPVPGGSEPGILLTDVFPATLLGDLSCPDPSRPCWLACLNDLGEVGDHDADNCPGTVTQGSGDISRQVYLAAGSSTTVEARVRLPLGASGSVANTASVALDADAPVSEWTPGGGSASSQIVIPIELSTDLVVTKTDDRTTAVAGAEHSYTVTVANTGFLGVDPVTVIDQLPLFDGSAFPGQTDNAGFVPGSIRWQCRAFDGGCCNSGTSNCGTGQPTAPVFADSLLRGDGGPVEVSLPGRSRVEFTITGTIDPRASGTLVNEARVELPEGVIDPNPGSNTDRDDDTVIVREASLQVSKTLVELAGSGENGDLPPFLVEYEITVVNNGPSYLPDVRISDPLDDDNFDLVSFQPRWTCQEINDPGNTSCRGNGALGVLADKAFAMDPGGEVLFRVMAATSDVAVGRISNTAMVNAGTGAPPFSASVTTSLIGQARLSIDKTDNRAEIAPGSVVDYVIRVENHGPDDVFGARVSDQFPFEVDSVVWTCDATTPIPGNIELSGFGVTPDDTGGDALAISPDGRHVYVASRPRDSLLVYSRNNVPGANFGEVVLLETQIDGVPNPGNPSAAVSGMQSPFEVAVTPDGASVYVLSASEPETRSGFVEQFSQGRWAPVTQNFGCGNSSASLDSNRLELVTAFNCGGIFAGYNHNGVETGGTVSFRWSVTESNPHDYVARFGVQGQPLDTLAFGTLTLGGPDSGTRTLRLEAGDQLVFNIAKSSGFGESRLIIEDFEFTPDVDVPATLSTFRRVINPASPDFGRLTFLGSTSSGIPDLPSALVATNQSVYVSGSGNPDGEPGNQQDVIAVFKRNAELGLLDFDLAHTAGVPPRVARLALDSGAGWLLAAGADLAAFRIEPAEGQTPAGRLALGDRLDPGLGADTLVDLALASGAVHAYARSADGRLLWLSWLDADGEAELVVRGSYQASELGLPGGAADPLRGPGAMQVAADGEHLAGVSRDQNRLYILRRDLVSGGLSFQESRVFDAGSGADRGLLEAAALSFAPDGRHLLVASGGDGAGTNAPLSVYSRRAPDPVFAFLEVELESDPAVSGLRSPTDVVVSPDGQHVYAVSLADHSLTRFNRFPRLGLDDQTQGQHLQFVRRWVDGSEGVTGLRDARRILVSPDGRSVFVSSEDRNTLAVFERDNDPASPQFGNLSFVQVLREGQGGVTGMNGPQGMAMDPGNRHLYVAGRFSNAIARFGRNADGTLSYLDRVMGGSNGVVGLNGIIDLAVSADGGQLLGVSSVSNALVVFDRNANPTSAAFGQLSFVQAQTSGVGSRPVALAISRDVGSSGEHVYVVAENSNSLSVFKRVTDPSSSVFGQVQLLRQLVNGSDGIAFMQGPRDVRVSPDGRRIYVAAANSAAVLVFDRDLNASSGRFGLPNLAEIRRQDVNGVDGLREVRALAISNDSRNVYAAGFASQAIAAFRLGTGSVCSAGGSGNIADEVDIGVGGTLTFRASGVVRPNASGTLSNTATVSVPDNVVALTLSNQGCPGGAPVCSVPLSHPTGCPGGADYCATDTTELVPAGELVVSKTANRVSLTAGEEVRYVVTIRNAGPSSLVNKPGFPLLLNDRLDELLDSAGNPAFTAGSGRWFCEAVGSGGLEVQQSWRNLDAGDPASGPFEGLAGISGLALLPAPSGDGHWLAAASIIDNALSVWSRDPSTGDLLEQAVVRSDQAGGALDGAQSVVASPDGGFLYVASRISDAVSVFALSETPAGAPQLALVQVLDGLFGLDKAVHLTLSPDAAGSHLYVSGANDNAVSVFARNADTGLLNPVQTLQHGVSGVSGLIGVSRVVLSPDGTQAYAVSPALGSVTWFDRNPSSGQLSWRKTYDGAELATNLQGAAGAVFDDSGRFLYVSAGSANRIVVLERDISSSGNAGALQFASFISQEQIGAGGLVGPRELAISPDQVHIYATSPAAGTVSWFVRDQADGSLRYSGVRGHQGAAGAALLGATGMAIDGRTGQLFVAATGEGGITQFARQTDSFCPASGSGQLVDVPFNIGAGGSVVFTIDVEVASNASGSIDNQALVTAARGTGGSSLGAGQSNVVAAVADLAISKTDGLSEIDGLGGATSVRGTNRHVYVAAPDDNAIGVFSRIAEAADDERGALSFVEVVRSGVAGVSGLTGVRDLQLSPDGAHLYAVSPLDNAVVALARDADSGRLHFVQLRQNGVQGVSGLSGASALAISADGRHVYVAGRFGNSVAVFARDADPQSSQFGQLSFLQVLQSGVGGVAGLGQPLALRLSGDGRHLYVLGADGDTVTQFQRNRTEGSANFGQLSYQAVYSAASQEISGLSGVRDLVISADGSRLYVLGTTTGTLVRFEREADSGNLGFLGFSQDGTGGVAGLTGARRLLLDDAAGLLYVASAPSAAIARFQVDPQGGPLQFAGLTANGDPSALTGGEVFGLEGVSGLLLSPDGTHLYAASRDRDALLVFDLREAEAGPQFQQIQIDGFGGVAPGEQVEYLIVVDNHGPSDVAEARVVDVFPDSFESVQWSCSPRQGSGANCQPGGLGNLDTIVSLPAGGRVTFRAVGTVSAGASGRLINTATVSAIGVTDPNLANNSATDDDTVLSPRMDLGVRVDSAPDPRVPGGPVIWDVTVTNPGPSSVRDAIVEDQVPAAAFDLTWQCQALPPAGILLEPVTGAADPDAVRLRISADGRFAYAVGGEHVEVFQRDPLSGQLQSRQRLSNGLDGVSGLRGARDLALSSDGRFVYVAAAQADAIVVFERSESSGLLSYRSTVRDGLGAEGLGRVARLLISPDGQHLYAGGLGALAGFTINPTTGALNQTGVLFQGVQGVDGLNEVTDLAWADNGTWLLVTARANESLAVFERRSGGVLSAGAVLLNDALAGGPAADALLEPMAVIRADDELLVAARSGDRIGRFRFDPDSGTLMPVGRIELAAADGGLSGPHSLVFDPDQARLYVALANELVLLSLLEPQVALVERYAATNFSALGGLRHLVAGPAGRHLYSLGAAAGAQLAVWPRERGSRCPLRGESALGRQAVDIVAGGELRYQINAGIRANAVGSFDYTVSVQPPLPGQEINPTDNTATDSHPLAPETHLAIRKQVESERVVAGLPVSWRLDVDNSGISDATAARVLDVPAIFPGQSAGVATGTGAWACQANPALGEPEFYPAPAPAQGLVVVPGASFAYAVDAGQGRLIEFPVLPDGHLGPGRLIGNGDILVPGDPPVAGLGGAAALAVSADGLSVYVAGAGDHSLAVFRRASADAPLRFVRRFVTTVPATPGSIPGLRGAASVVLSADQRHLFVAGSLSNAIVVFRRDPIDGSLTYVERVADGLGTIEPAFDVIRGVRLLHAGADGDRLYAWAADSRAFSQFRVNPDTGILGFESVSRTSSLPGLADARAIAASPDDSHLYLLGADRILVFDRDGDGFFAGVGEVGMTVDLVQPRALQVDDTGARAYLLDATADGTVIHALRRDWSTGALQFWFSRVLDGPLAGALAHDPANRQVYVVAASDQILRFDEQPLSRCPLPAGETDGLDAEVDLGVGGWSWFDVTATVHPSARGELVNQASVAAATGIDPDLSDNQAETRSVIEVVSDLVVTHSAPAEVVAGTTLRYQTVVANHGPSDALGVELNNLVPTAPLLGMTWTCDASARSSCPASGSGPPSFTADVSADGQLTLTIDAQIDPAFIGELISVVRVTPEPGSTDPNPDAQRDEVVTEIVAVADIGLVKTTVGEVIAGNPVHYRLTLVNDGPSDAPAVRVIDDLGAFKAADWTCAGSGGGGCAEQSGSGSIDQLLELPVGAGAVFDIIVPLPDTAQGSLFNQASAEVQLPATDPDPAGAVDAVSDLIRVVPDVSVQLDADFEAFDPAGTGQVQMRASIANAGPSRAREVAVVIDWSRPEVSAGELPDGCQLAAPGSLLCALGELAPGRSRELSWMFDDLPAAPGELVVDALVASAGDDPDLDNNSDQWVIDLQNGIDLDIRVSNGFSGLAPGQTLDYSITVTNLGTVAASLADVTASVPPALKVRSWSCQGMDGAQCGGDGSGTGDLVDTGMVPPGGQLRYRLTVTVEPDLDPVQTPLIEVSARVDVRAPEVDINLRNNEAVARDPVIQSIFRDRFEVRPPQPVGWNPGVPGHARPDPDAGGSDGWPRPQPPQSRFASILAVLPEGIRLS